MITPLLFFIVMLIFSPKQEKINKLNINTEAVDLVKISPPALQVYHAINKYAPENDIPYKIAFGVAKMETGYFGPLDLTYDYRQTSFAGAEGGMQFMIKTARWVAKDETLTRKEIRHNIDLNVELSMKYLRMLNDRYSNWSKTLGYYNTGYPRVNSYAVAIVKTMY